jgi:hypothetical protein
MDPLPFEVAKADTLPGGLATAGESVAYIAVCTVHSAWHRGGTSGGAYDGGFLRPREPRALAEIAAFSVFDRPLRVTADVCTAFATVASKLRRRPRFRSPANR